jgi:hypothetical protein
MTKTWRLPYCVMSLGADDVGVVEGGDGAGLAVEALEGGGVFGAVRRQDLDGDLPAEGDVLAEVDGAHAALAEGREDLVRAEQEAAVPAGEELAGLEAREDAVGDQRLGGLGGAEGQGVAFEVGVEAVGRHDAAALEELQQGRGGGRRGHTSGPQRERLPVEKTVCLRYRTRIAPEQFSAAAARQPGAARFLGGRNRSATAETERGAARGPAGPAPPLGPGGRRPCRGICQTGGAAARPGIASLR